MKTMLLSVTVLAGLVPAAAFAQAQPAPSPAYDGGQAIVGGKDIQPEGGGQKLGPLPGLDQLLQEDDAARSLRQCHGRRCRPRYAGGKALSSGLFRLERFPLGWTHPSDKKSLQINTL
jgi:hypothetical protein